MVRLGKVCRRISVALSLVRLVVSVSLLRSLVGDAVALPSPLAPYAGFLLLAFFCLYGAFLLPSSYPAVLAGASNCPPSSSLSSLLQWHVSPPPSALSLVHEPDGQNSVPTDAGCFFSASFVFFSLRSLRSPSLSLSSSLSSRFPPRPLWASTTNQNAGMGVENMREPYFLLVLMCPTCPQLAHFRVVPVGTLSTAPGEPASPLLAL